MANLKDIAATLAILGSGALVMSGCGKDAPATEVPGDAEAAPADDAAEGSCSGDKTGEGSCAGDAASDAEADAEAEASCSGEKAEGSCSGE